MAQPKDNVTEAGSSEEGVVLLLQVPRANEKKELAAEQMFASLHGLLTIPAAGGGFFKSPVKRERLSIEIAVLGKRIGFYVWVPKYLKSFVEEQIYAQYPSVQISPLPDYTMNDERHFATTLVTEMKLATNDVLPIKTFQSFEVDPLAAITATLGKFEEDEEAWVQLVIKPAAQQWHRKSEQYLSRLRGGKTGTANILATLWSPEAAARNEAKRLAEHEQIRANGAETKSQKLAFECQVRMVYRGNVNEAVAKLRMQSIVASYKQFNTTYLNGFAAKRIINDPFLVAHYRSREFNRGGYTLNIEEVATLYHLPHSNMETPYILWAASQTAEPPANLPVITTEQRHDVSPVANTNFRGRNTMFGMPRGDRGRHLYILGQTGVGKSGLLELLTISDIYSPYGFAVIDPHGDYAQNILQRIPAERADDVIYFNPADTDFPMAFNPMEVNDPKLKTHTCSELIGVLKRMFESWGPRLEYVLRYSILALLDFPDATMLDITRILTDKKFRQEVLRYVADSVVRNFWTVEFASWNDQFAAEVVAPVLNKLGAFTANPVVRNIIGQPKSSFNIRQIMDEHKILIVNLSRGLVGEDNAGLLGALLVTKVQLAAMSRADIPAGQRDPFYLYVDEFQNFATESFATILSEARKYGLCLTVANQYIAQMPMEVRDAVFGNVGSIVAFRMSADDARGMMKYFEPRFAEHDLIHMHNRHFVVNMTIEGEKTPAFSGITLNLPPIEKDEASALIIDRARATYASSREFVERYVGEHYLGAGKLQQPKQNPTPHTPEVAPPSPTPTSVLPAERAQQSAKELPPAALDLGLAVLEKIIPPRRPPETPAAPDVAKKPAHAKRPRRRKAKSVATPATDSEAAKIAKLKPVPPKPSPAPSDEPQEFKASSVIHLK